MQFLLTGGTGLIGQAVSDVLLQEGHALTILTRDAARAKRCYHATHPHANHPPSSIRWIESLDQAGEGYDIVINLAGEPLSPGRWTQKKKDAIYHSRIGITEALVAYMAQAKKKPSLLISGSAIGCYGTSLSERFTEETLPASEDFAQHLCAAWEACARQAEDVGVRVCLLRTGIVLSTKGGALKQMLPPFKMGLGGPMGAGDQWMSWVHIEDVVGLIQHLIAQENLRGPINLTAPEPVRNAAFAKTLAEALHRPALLRMPGWVLRLLFGETAEALLLKGQCVEPSVAAQSGYVFRYPSLKKALAALVG